MKFLNGRYYVEVKDKRYRIHPTENIISRLRDPPQSLRTQNQVENQTEIRKNQKVIRDDNNELVVKNYSENKQPIIQQPKFKLPNCPSCKQNNWLEFDKGYYCKNCEFNINKQKHQIDKKVLRQDHNFSTRLIYANKKIREIYYSMVNTRDNSTEYMIIKLQSLKGKTKLIKFYKNINNYYDNTNFKMDEDPSSKYAQGFGKIFHEVIFLMNFLQTKPQVKNMNISYYDLYHTVIKIRDEKKFVDNQCENDYINFDDLLLLIIKLDKK